LSAIVWNSIEVYAIVFSSEFGKGVIAAAVSAEELKSRCVDKAAETTESWE
jgi:hypothetical protein